jgi:hypothetical protein
MKVKAVVTAVSGKKDMGWVRFVPADGKWKWDEFGAHFQKEEFLAQFVAPGLYVLDLENTALGFGERPKYTVEGVELLGTFEELAENA